MLNIRLYLNSKLGIGNIMMDMHIQAELYDKRGEHDLAALLREIVAESQREDRVNMARRVEAENLLLIDGDR